MARPGKPGRFKISNPAPVAVAAQKAMKTGSFRGSPRERGYDAKWDGISLRFRRLNPFCLFCSQEGRTSLTDVADHIIPVQDRPELVHDWKNLVSACISCNNKKKAWEAYARENDMVDLLPMWVKEPMTRPPQFRCEAVR